MPTSRAERIRVSGEVAEPPLRDELRERALQLELGGWVRITDEGVLCAHLEGQPGQIHALVAWLQATGRVAAVDESPTRVEGHEQFMIRGVEAGVFVVQEHRATTHHFDLRLEVDGVMRSWTVPRGPSLDPAIKRLAVQVEDHQMTHNSYEGRTASGGVIVWDRGGYEQGGRVPWPEALDRGHAVFNLHGEKLKGGFALQRTGVGEKPRWLLIKRRDEYARSGSDVVAEEPRSVQSGLDLDSLIDR